MTRSKYKEQANNWNTHDILFLDTYQKYIHALKCPCWGNDYDERGANQRKYSDAQRIEFATIYYAGLYSDEPEESPERDHEDETDHPTVGLNVDSNLKSTIEVKSTVEVGSTMVPKYALYSISHNKFIAILSQDERVMEWNHSLQWGYGTRALIIPIEIALEMHSAAKFERERSELQKEKEINEIAKQKFIEDGQMFYAQLCTKVKKAAS